MPDDPHLLGWWQGGARPGSRQGSVVIDGHVDTAARGPGALFSLRQLRPGDPVVLSTNHGSWHYLVVALRSYPKVTLPAEVFTSTGPPRLVIILRRRIQSHNPPIRRQHHRLRPARAD